MPDPVSWLMIEPGWKVFASDGAEIGSVDEVAGDDGHDIFDGLLKAKLRGSGLEPYVEVVAHIDTEEEKRLVPIYRLQI